MRKCSQILSGWFLLLIPAVAATTNPTMPTYTNPVIAETLADPSVILHNGTFFLFATGDGSSYRAYTSTDLVNWKRGQIAYDPGIGNLWAPDIYHHPEDGTFYIYDTANFTIGVARADQIEGPFTRIKELVAKAIDAHLFRDDDGELYLYYTVLPSFTIHVQKMKDPVTVEGHPIPLIGPELPWETNGNRITEGPFLMKRKGVYYLTYSGSGAKSPDYAIGYATSGSPMGPFRKSYQNPIISRGSGIYGPGHNSLITLPSGQTWIVYHQKLSNTIGYDRKICIDRITFTKDGKMQATPTRGTPQPAPVIEKEAAQKNRP